MILTDSNGGKKLVEYLDTGEYKKVLLPSWHGIGDLVMFMAPVVYLRKLYPNIQIDVGLAKGLQEEVFFPGVILLEGDWRESLQTSDYDLIFACNMPLEDSNNTTKTKAEVCCEQELGIPPVWGHLHIKSKPIVGVHFQNTSVSSVANCSEEVAGKIWNEITLIGGVPLETLFEHVFHNPINKKFDFIDKHVRNWPANLDSCISLISHCDFFVGTVSGNFHIALSVLPYYKVCLLERDLKVGHFTKLPVKGVDIKNYRDGEISDWLKSMGV